VRIFVFCGAARDFKPPILVILLGEIENFSRPTTGEQYQFERLGFFWGDTLGISGFSPE
jgi:hypothetical protein